MSYLSPEGMAGFTEQGRRNLHRDQYAAVVLANFLGHVERPNEAVENCFKIIKPGGVLAIQTPDFANPWMMLPKNVRNKWRHFIGSYF